MHSAPLQPLRQQQQLQQLQQQQQHHRDRFRALLLLLLLLASSVDFVKTEAPEQRSALMQSALMRSGAVAHRKKWPEDTEVSPVNLTIGYLPAIKGGLKDRQGLAISGAITIALNEMNLRRFWKISTREGQGKKRTEVRTWKGIPGLEKRLTRGERRMRGDSGDDGGGNGGGGNSGGGNGDGDSGGGGSGNNGGDEQEPCTFLFLFPLYLACSMPGINNDPNILPNINLVMRWSDTRGETVEATRAMLDMICDGVVAFFGPEGTCFVEATVSESRNIPMMSYTLLSKKTMKVKEGRRTGLINRLSRGIIIAVSWGLEQRIKNSFHRRENGGVVGHWQG
ncbi:hypothetical protein ALC53_04623 [Atta colombica]|uniref:Receptor ligand binding region domain-containing protein n=1 Tax=Atta colombica TaxID=520822 RepID=A0A195BKZ1_9HYME|nr:hypothetical protein ALC53_04623 [Atta colombica]